jgi:hypothetical protein
MSVDQQGRYIAANDSAPVGPRLIRVDPILGSATLFQFPYLNGIRGLAFSPSGVCYALDSDGSGVTNTLYWLDLTVPVGDSSIKHFIGQTNIAGIQDMTFAADGTLYAWSVDNGLITIDPTTAQATDVNGLFDGTSSIQAIAFAPDGTLYGAGHQLYVIDRITGQFTQIGTADLGDIRGMAYFDVSATVTYCHAKMNSQGCVPSISYSGSASLSGSDNFFVGASDVINQRLGLLLWSRTPSATPFQGGTLCLHAPIVRTGMQNSGGNVGVVDCSGQFQFHFSQSYMIANGLVAGTSLNAQYYYRDTSQSDGTGVGLTNALHFTIAP